MEELATGAKLENDVVVLSGFGEVDKTDDVGVIQLPHDLNLFEDVGSLRRIASVLISVDQIHICSSVAYAHDGGSGR
jgi:hypothetical protein